MEFSVVLLLKFGAVDRCDLSIRPRIRCDQAVRFRISWSVVRIMPRRSKIKSCTATGPLKLRTPLSSLIWRYGPDLYQCTLGVIVAASSGVLSANKVFGNKKL